MKRGNYHRNRNSQGSNAHTNQRASSSVDRNRIKSNRRSLNHSQNNSKSGTQFVKQDAGIFQPSERSQDNTRKFHIGFKLLEEWSHKDAPDILVELMVRKTEFDDLVTSNELSGDTICLIIKIFAKVCSSAFIANKPHITNLALKDQFIYSLQNYLFRIPLQENSDKRSNSYLWKDLNGFFIDLSTVCVFLIETVPIRACKVLPKTVNVIYKTITTLVVFEHGQVTDNTLTNVEKLEEKLQRRTTEIKQRKGKLLCKNLNDTPPDNFRDLSVYPLRQEIVSAKQTFLRQNIIDRSYHDVDHYLDVQFRLLKEDFVASLREGINKFISLRCDVKERNRMKFSNVVMHRQVEFIRYYFSELKTGILVQFGFKKKQTQSNDDYSKRFMFGSLLCFTNDNFASIIFGKVVVGDKLLQQQQVVVEFEPGHNNLQFNKPYLMVECSVYFEPYYHVLKALQNIYEDSFPMKKYLINTSSVSEPPGYVDRRTTFDIQGRLVTLLGPWPWPTASTLKFDETQYTAFKSALTQRFSVIQGPPGTGKTYLGLQIAKTIINNKSCWYNTAQAPILVVSCTNQALDQFLEGLLDTTDRIVRVGGQSKNEKLEPFSIRNKRQSIGQRTPNRALYNVRNTLKHKLSLMKCLSDKISIIDKLDGIICFHHFDFVDSLFSGSWFASASEKAIIEWLLDGRTHSSNIHRFPIDTLMDVQDGEAKQPYSIEREEELFDLWLPAARTTLVLNLVTIENNIRGIKLKLQECEGDSSEQVAWTAKLDLEMMLLNYQEHFEYLKMRLNEGKQYMHVSIKETWNPAYLDQPHQMSPENRWKLYFYWTNLYKTGLCNKLENLQDEYRVLYQQHNELKEIDDIQIMKQMLVVGMTTTGAARLHKSLQTLKCRIVIVEEAAEVLESHVVASLTDSCQQLILIGDHKQLRPSTATYELEKNFNLGISLFERMFINKIQCHVLGVQHRMRPEFAKLIVPTIYPTLKNHKDVENYRPIIGIVSSLYFITHTNLEEDAGETSKENLHEAQFLLALARYLIQNGYKPEDITILAAYSGQLFALQRLRSKHDLLLEEVRITVLDGFQGEESKIILLSLVRNNEENKIGFLKIENRVCVALSRAREGFYIMGNMDMLSSNSHIWFKIKEALVKQQSLGTSLPLQCQVHPHIITKVASANDFPNTPGRGCSNVCGALLKCGHSCLQVCHFNDREHKTTICKMKCERVLCKNNHKCQKLCNVDCGECEALVIYRLLCGHKVTMRCFVDLSKYNCTIPVDAKLPCNHEVQAKPCYLDVTVVKCNKPCERTSVGCSTGKHICPKRCHEKCGLCDTVVKKQRVCSHQFMVPCSSNVDAVTCYNPCRRTLSCHHQCTKKCFEICGACQEPVDKILPFCKHTVVVKCSEAPDATKCRGKCTKSLPCGHPCAERCNEPCTIQCSVLVNHTKPVDCGHTFQIPCHMKNQELSSNSFVLLQHCRQPCYSKLLCTHFCSGTCGECLQGRIHKKCQEKCGLLLVCGHECSTPCELASYNNIYEKICADPCTKCVKQDDFGSFTRNESKYKLLLLQLGVLSHNSVQLKTNLNDICIVIGSLTTAIKRFRYDSMNMAPIYTLAVKIQILERIIEILYDAKLNESITVQNMLALSRLLLRPLLPADQRLSHQEITDIHTELNRLVCLVQLSQIEEDLPIINNKHKITKLHNEMRNLIFGVQTFDYNTAIKEKMLKLFKEKKLREVIRKSKYFRIVGGNALVGCALELMYELMH